MPIQTGAGWYIDGSEATLTTDSLVFYESEVFAFDHWSGIAGVDSTSPVLTFIVDAPESVIAIYGQGVIVTFLKNPRQNFGGFIIDGDTIPGVDSLTSYWTYGSMHSIAPTNPDYSGDTARYVFTGWHDSPIAERNVGPILGDTTFTANYDLQYVYRIIKNPAADTFGTVSINSLFWSDGESDSVEAWFDVGEPITGQVSALDISPDGNIKFSFTRWNDGITDAVRFDTLTHPIELEAEYTGQVFIIVGKDPSSNTFGWISIGDSVYDGASMVFGWVPWNEPYPIGVSHLDLDLDSDIGYVFNHWSDGGDTVHDIICTSTEIFIAYYDAVEMSLHVCITNDTVNFGAMNINESRATETTQAPVVENCGNFPLDYGLRVYDSGGFWIPALMSGYDIFVLRSRFEDLATTPLLFNPMRDMVKSTTSWANEDDFGPFGFAVEPEETYRLWLQLIAPSGSSIYDTRQELIMVLSFKPHLP